MTVYNFIFHLFSFSTRQFPYTKKILGNDAFFQSAYNNFAVTCDDWVLEAWLAQEENE